MVRKLRQLGSYSPSRLVTIGTITFLLLVLTAIVRIRIILEWPNYGDVTDTLWTAWQAVLAVATVGSFLIAIYNTFTKRAESDGSSARFQIGGENHDINVHFHEDDTRGAPGGASVDQSAEDDAESSDRPVTRVEGVTERGTDST